MTSDRQIVPNPSKPPIGSYDLIYALNAIATALQVSIRSEENVYLIFQEQVVALGLRGGISEYDRKNQSLVFKTVAFTNPIQKVLADFEKKLKISARGYSINIHQVDVYQKVILESQAVFVPDTSTIAAQVVPHSINKIIQPLLRFLGQPPGIFTPIIYNGQVMGMLNIVGSKLTSDDIPTMQAFANQIAVALENARLVNQLQSAKDALEIAYQKTLEGWVKALELRDNETEGHTLRVANITVRLADFMGVSENEQNYIRQGALLHDIGKMAIPDSILLKPAPLSEAEWVVMKQHPVTAYTWLKDIDYLGSAVNIPHYHHEHWDGSGYPEGLHSEEIPLWARIFTIVDVWDAMLSDRPYRKAITIKDTLSYLNQETDKLFDPTVSEAFFDLLSQKPEVNEIHQIPN